MIHFLVLFIIILHNNTLEHPRPFIIELNPNEPDSKKQMYWAGSPAPLSRTISIPYLVYRNVNDERNTPSFEPLTCR